MLRVKKTHEDAILPSRANSTDAGLDLRCVEDIRLKSGEQKLVDTGLSIKVPDGHAGFVTPRSGHAHRHGLTVTNSPGVIDSSYTGPLKVILKNLGQYTIEFKAKDRIAQLLIVPVRLSEVVEVEEFEATERGEGGFGSSGTQ